MSNRFTGKILQNALRVVALSSVLLSGLSTIASCGGDGNGEEPITPPQSIASASNQSITTLCAEESNINIPFAGNVEFFSIQATHPQYPIQSYSCEPDRSNCPAPPSDYPFNNPGVFKLFDDGQTVVEAVREKEWWRPSGMAAAVDNQEAMTDIHSIRIYRKIVDSNEWPQFFILDMDGNVKLIPHPPMGVEKVCYGGSVLVGPAVVAQRPIAEIKSVKYLSSSMTVEVSYLFGGSATLSLKDVNRSMARVNVSVNYPTRDPFTTFRSMFVEVGNADVDHVQWSDASGAQHDDPIMQFPGGEGTEWLFYRTTSSKHKDSAPAILIDLN